MLLQSINNSETDTLNFNVAKSMASFNQNSAKLYTKISDIHIHTKHLVSTPINSSEKMFPFYRAETYITDGTVVNLYCNIYTDHAKPRRYNLFAVSTGEHINNPTKNKK